MWITQPVATRIFVWLAAIAIPFQGLPSVSCGCTRAEIFSYEASTTRSCSSKPAAGRCSCTGASVCRCGESSSCCQEGLADGSTGDVSDSSCQCGTGCQCGNDCHCGDNNVPTKPAVPLSGNNSPERTVADIAGTADFVSFYLPSTTRQPVDVHAGAYTLSALACCVALCRFTL